MDLRCVIKVQNYPLRQQFAQIEVVATALWFRERPTTSSVFSNMTIKLKYTLHNTFISCQHCFYTISLLQLHVGPPNHVEVLRSPFPTRKPDNFNFTWKEFMMHWGKKQHYFRSKQKRRKNLNTTIPTVGPPQWTISWNTSRFWPRVLACKWPPPRSVPFPQPAVWPV